MQLINIEENNITEEEQNDSCVIGIDLGTTNSLVAYSSNREPKILHEEGQTPEIKSLVNIHDSGEITIGVDDSKDITTLRSIKRLMGKTINDLDDNLKKYQYDYAENNSDNRIIELTARNTKITPVEAQAEILKQLKHRAEQILDKEINQAVITVPAYFDDASRQATKDAAALSGLETLRLLNEPTAAAIAYGLDNKMEGYYAVYDFGGGTFDVSVLKMVKGVFQVIATKGDNFLGGDDIDIAICQYLKESLDTAQIDQQKLLDIAKQAKEYFSKHTSGFSSHGISINYDDFEKIILPTINKTINIFDECIKDANIDISDIKELILVGGSTKIPTVKKLLQTHLNKKPLDSVNPDTVVAIGAAIQAENLTVGSGDLLLDIIPLSLGIETMGEVIEKIIPRNSTIPISTSQEFTTYKDNQTGIKIHIVQGERELASQNRSLAFFELKNLPPLPAGEVKVKISFNVDTDGILTVTASESTTNNIQKVQVKPSYGLTTDEMQIMLSDSYNNAKSDMLQRMLHKNHTDIEQFLDAIKKIADDKTLKLSKAQKEPILELCKKSQKDAKAFLTNKELKKLDALHKYLKEYLNKLCIDKITKITDALKGENIANINQRLENKNSN